MTTYRLTYLDGPVFTSTNNNSEDWMNLHLPLQRVRRRKAWQHASRSGRRRPGSICPNSMGMNRAIVCGSTFQYSNPFFAT